MATNTLTRLLALKNSLDKLIQSEALKTAPKPVVQKKAAAKKATDKAKKPKAATTKRAK